MRRVPWLWGIFLGAFALFAWAVAPGLYLRDSGELTTAAFSLGIAHETGFPLWCLLGKLAALVPLGEVATRLGLFSALCAALAATSTACLVARLVGSQHAAAARVAGLGGAALLVASYTFWKQAAVAEVYAPTAAALCLALLLAEGAARGERRAGLGLALLCGLALGLHASFRLLLLPPLIILMAWRLRRGDRWPLLAPLLLAVGGLAVAYLPLRAARGPVANWGDPETLGRLWNHLAAARIRRAFADQILSRDWPRVWLHGRVFLAQIEGQVGMPALLAGGGGLAWLIVRRRAIGLLAGCLILGECAYAAWVNPMGIADLQCGVPALVGLALAAGVGIGVAAQGLSTAATRRAKEEDTDAHAGARLLATPALALALAGLVVVPAALANAGTRFGLKQEAPAWVDAALRDLPARSLVLVRSDDLAAGTLYAQAVWGLRPDVTVLVRQHLWDAPYLAERVRRAGSDLVDRVKLEAWGRLGEDERIAREREMLRLIVEGSLGRRAVMWEPGDDVPPLGYLTASLPLARLELRPPPLPSVRSLIERIESLLGAVEDEMGRRLEVTALTQLAARYLEQGDEHAAGSLYRVGLALRPDDAVAGLGLGVVHARRGDFAAAASLAEHVAAEEPDRVVARLNAGSYRLVLGDLAAARRHFEEAQRLRPHSAAPLVGLARVAAAAHQLDAARRYLTRAQAIEPGDAAAEALRRELNGK